MDESVPKHTGVHTDSRTVCGMLHLTQLHWSCSERSWSTALVWVGHREHPSSLLPLSQPCARLELRAHSRPLCAMWHFLQKIHTVISIGHSQCHDAPAVVLSCSSEHCLSRSWVQFDSDATLVVIRLVDYFLQRRSQAHMLVPVWCTIRCKPLVVMALSNAVHSFTQTHT